MHLCQLLQTRKNEALSISHYMRWRKEIVDTLSSSRNIILYCVVIVNPMNINYFYPIS
ncbi:hypothetical protein Patl1_27109 [Pistacia atlantica]|uniref:Uncharacterized protein n=1 Tax=Pistacia atlantica TaxID=434234 RepID=A0ACC1B277_9ROSI|nr:hypothetical protein Patl1_27109 [Pistacia atlantica]